MIKIIKWSDNIYAKVSNNLPLLAATQYCWHWRKNNKIFVKRWNVMSVWKALQHNFFTCTLNLLLSCALSSPKQRYQSWQQKASRFNGRCNMWRAFIILVHSLMFIGQEAGFLPAFFDPQLLIQWIAVNHSPIIILPKY